MVFISHAWINGEPDEKVLWLVAKLRESGFDARCDVMFTGNRTSIHFKQMMAENMQNSDKVIVVLSDLYKKKADTFMGGVGVEYKYILEDIDVNQGKYILVSFENYPSDSEIPDFLKGREIIYLNYFFEKLIYRLEDIPEYKFPDVNPKRDTVNPNIITTIKNFSDTFLNRKENLPFIRNPFFSSREGILQSLHENFFADNERQIIQVLSGIGGVGKTQIALEYSYTFLDKYKLVWWIKSETKQGIINSFMELGRNLGISNSKLNLNEDEKVALIIENLNYVKKYLLIYDNVNCYNEIERYLPKGNTGSILITSRDNNWKMIGNVISVDVFTPQEAINFIRNRTLSDDLLGVEILSKRLGFLPLAIEQAVAYILNNALSFLDYVELFEKYKLKLFDLESSKPLNYSYTVTITSRLSINKINNESSVQMLKIISFYEADSIELGLFLNSKKILPFPLSEQIGNELLLKEMLWELKRYSLIKEEDGKIFIHRLLQEVIQEDNDMKSYFEYAYKIITNIIYLTKEQSFFDESIYKGLGSYHGLRPHVISLCEKMKPDYKAGNDLWFDTLNQWYKRLFESNGIESSPITTVITEFFKIVILICSEVQDLDYFMGGFIWLIENNKYKSSYLNSTIGNYFIPLLEYLDNCPDDINTAFYIVMSVVGGRNGWRNYDKERDLMYLERAKKIYSFYGRTETINYLSNYNMLMKEDYKWDKEFHEQLLH